MVAVLPTGYGKSLVFHVLPRLLNERDAIALPRVHKLCLCSFSPGSVPKFSTQSAVNKSIGTDDLDIIFGVG